MTTRVNTISVFSSESISKNASAFSDAIYLGKCGPSTNFWVDLNASGGANFAVTYQVGDTPDETFIGLLGLRLLIDSHQASELPAETG